MKPVTHQNVNYALQFIRQHPYITAASALVGITAFCFYARGKDFSFSASDGFKAKTPVSLPENKGSFWHNADVKCDNVYQQNISGGTVTYNHTSAPSATG